MEMEQDDIIKLYREETVGGADEAETESTQMGKLKKSYSERVGQSVL